jgi:hypothetical protein
MKWSYSLVSYSSSNILVHMSPLLELGRGRRLSAHPPRLGTIAAAVSNRKSSLFLPNLFSGRNKEFERKSAVQTAAGGEVVHWGDFESFATRPPAIWVWSD